MRNVVAAFAVDPLLRWVWPDTDRYAGCAARFFGLLLDLRLMGGEVWVAGEGAAVAMWDPPGGLYAVPSEDPWPALHEDFTAEERERWAAFDTAVAVPADVGPYWYLGVLATDPAHQRRGLAAAVLDPVLAAADRTGTPAYLETASTTNVAYYARHGFTSVHEVDLAGGPRCWLMRREAQVTRG